MAVARHETPPGLQSDLGWRPEGSHLEWRHCSPDVIRGSSGVEEIDDGASSRIAACGLHPGYKGRAYAIVARMRPEGSLMNVKPWQGQTIIGCRPDDAFH